MTGLRRRLLIRFASFQIYLFEFEPSLNSYFYYKPIMAPFILRLIII